MWSEAYSARLPSGYKSLLLDDELPSTGSGQAFAGNCSDWTWRISRRGEYRFADKEMRKCVNPERVPIPREWDGHER
jgi:hypothetical protein